MLQSGEPLKVVIYVHGGGFGYFSAEYFGDDYPSRLFLRRNLMIVVMQSRIGLYGMSLL